MLDDEMIYALTKFIDDNEVLINTYQWAKIYKKAADKLSNFGAVGKFTELLLSEGIDPLADLDYIPRYYLQGARIAAFVIPKHIKRIDGHAFESCYDLTNITIPNGLKRIGEGVFYWCENLTSVTIPNSVTEIGKAAFAYCSELERINIPNGVTSIGERTFRKCYELKKIVLPDSVTNIAKSAFQDGEKNLDITICASKGSYAEKFANENNFSFEEI